MAELRGQGVDGYVIESLQEPEPRAGAWLASVDGREAPVGKPSYAALTGPLAWQDLAASVLQRAATSETRVVFIDEVERVGLVDHPLRQAFDHALTHGPRLVMTAGLQDDAFLDAVRHRRDVELVPISASTWKSVHEELSLRLRAVCDDRAPVQQVQRHADEICEMIVSEEIPAVDIEIQQARLREAVRQLMPDQLTVFAMLHERRFRRLWDQFRHRTAL